MNQNVDNSDDVILLEDEMEDDLLARVLEESLRHFREVELPYRQSQQDDFEKLQTSRDGAQGSSTASSGDLSKEPILYAGQDAEGFDLSAGHNWIYPTNYPFREYQFTIVKSALFKNTLVSLPTGLGKTFIAAVVMYNFYRWFPRGKVIFMAPTKPLVNQQIDSCYKVMGIPKDHTEEMTGSLPPHERAVAWEKKRVFFLTPQVLTNDLTCGICPAASIKCIVVDEAHKAQGNQSYCQVMRALFPFNNKFRVLALSATPGSDMTAVTQVIKNLLISHIELRNEESPDIAEFTHKRKVELVVVSLGAYISGVKERFLKIADRYLGYLIRNRIISGSLQNLTKFGLLQAREAFRQNPPSHIVQGQNGNIESSFAIGVTLLHSLELLSLHGLRSFLKFLDGVMNEERGQAVVQNQLKHETDLQQLLEELKAYLGPENQEEPEPDVSMALLSSVQLAAPIVYSHPKLEKLQEVVVGHFRDFQEKNTVTRAMIFCQYRDTVIEICHILQRFQPLVKPMTFVGQSSSGKQSKGFSQKQQLMVMNKFRVGGYNTLISTCVGEEGLDIGEVDLIVCYDAHKSPIRLVQRMGRTGRKREGRIVMLMTEGKEYSKYKVGMYKSNTLNKNLLEGNRLAAHMYRGNPRMIPPGANPKCYQMFVTLPPEPEKKTKKKNQDIRKLFGRAHGNNEMGSENIPSSSPYCTAEDLEELGWDGKSFPEFNMLPEAEELHAMNADDLRHHFDSDFISNESEDSQKVNLRKWLEWQRHLQHTGIVSHTVDSQMFIDLLNYADQKRCAELPLTQAAGLMSQVNTSALWKKKKGRRKRTVNKKTSNTKCIGKKSQIASNVVWDKNSPILSGTDEEGTPITDYFRVPAPVRSVLPTIAEKTEYIDKERHDADDMEIVQLPIDVDTASISKTKEKSSMVIENMTSARHCYFCKKGLFDCSVMTPYVETYTRRANIEKYEPIDLSLLDKINKEYIASLDINELLTPPNSPVSDIFDKGMRLTGFNSVKECVEEDSKVEKSRPNIKLGFAVDQCNDEIQNGELNAENALLDKSTKIEGKSKPNFELNFSLFDQCLFDEELEPQDVVEETSTTRKEFTPMKTNSKPLGKKNDELMVDDMVGITKNDTIEIMWESSNIAQRKRISKLIKQDNTPAKSEKEHSFTKEDGLKKAPRILLSPLSPILCSQRKKKHFPEKHGKILPTSSTPKVHRRNLFSRTTFGDDRECELNITKGKDAGEIELSNERDESNDNSFSSLSKPPSHPKINFDLGSSPLSKPPSLPKINFDVGSSSLSKPPSLPKINFDLGSCSQLFDFDDDEQESNVIANDTAKSAARTSVTFNDITHNTTMYTVTQLLAMVDKHSTSSENINSSLTHKLSPAVNNATIVNNDSLKRNKSITEPETLVSSQKLTHYKQSFSENKTDILRCKTVQHSISSTTKEVSKELEHPKRNIPKQAYFHDSEDDMFADLAGDCEDDIFCEQKSDSIGNDSDTLIEKVQSGVSYNKSPSVAHALPVDLYKEKMGKNSDTSVHCLSRKLVPECNNLTKTSSDQDLLDRIIEKLKQKPEISSKPETLPRQKECEQYNVTERTDIDSVTSSISSNIYKGIVVDSVDNTKFPTHSIVPNNENLSESISSKRNDRLKLCLSLKLKPETTLSKSSEQKIVPHFFQKEDSVLSLKLTPKDTTLDSFEKKKVPVIRKQSNEDKFPDEMFESESLICNKSESHHCDVKNKIEDSIFDSQCSSFLIPGFANLSKNLPTVVDASNDVSTKSRLSLKRKVCLERSNTSILNATERNNGSLTTPKLKKLKSDNKTTLEVAEVDYKEMFLSGVKNTPMSSPLKTGKQLIDKSVRLGEPENVNREKEVTMAKRLDISIINRNDAINPISEDDSPIARPFIRKKTANISTTSNESISLPKMKLLSVNETASRQITSSYSETGWLNAKANDSTSSEENNNSIMFSNTKRRNNEFVNKRQIHNIKSSNEIIHAVLTDDSDFESQAIARQKKTCGSRSVDQEGKHPRKNKHRGKNQKKAAQRCPFVESEAEESDKCPSSSDGENTSGLDDYDSSFVSESGTQTHTDIQAKFLNSMIRSPGRQHGKFKIPTSNAIVPLDDIYSQIEEECGNSYQEDSFCVEGEDFTEMMEESVLEVAEAALEAEAKWRKRKRKKCDHSSSDDSDCVIIENVEENKKNNSNKHKKRRRIVTLSSSDSDEDDCKMSSFTVNKETQSQAQSVAPIAKNNEGKENSERSVQCMDSDGEPSTKIHPTKQMIINHLNPQNKEGKENTKRSMHLTDADGEPSTKVQPTKQMIINRLSPIKTNSSKGETASVKELISELDFSDWDFDDFAVPKHEGTENNQDKSEERAGVGQKRNKADDAHLKIDWGKKDNLNNFELRGIDELLQSSILSGSCANKSQSERNQTNYFDDVEFGDLYGTVVSPVLSCSGRPRKSSNNKNDIPHLNNIDNKKLDVSPVLSCSGQPKNAPSKAIRSLGIEFENDISAIRASNFCEGKHPKQDYRVFRPKSSTVQSMLSEFGVKQTPREQSTEISNEVIGSCPPTIIMSTRQGTSAPEIATALRALHKAIVLVTSISEADYITSWRLGVLRFALTDFMHGGPSNNGLGNLIRTLRSHFMKQVLILENDKMTPVATSTGLRREIWRKNAVHYIASLRQAGVCVLYSSDKADTARLIAKLAQFEAMKECGIKTVPKNIPGLDARLQFYRSLPNVNMALAMQICHRFPRIMDFLDSCNTVKKIQDVLSLDGEKAIRIYLVLHRTMKPEH